MPDSAERACEQAIIRAGGELTFRVLNCYIWPMDQDEQHLNLLSIFHYVLGGLTILCSFLLLVHIGAGIALVVGGFQEGEAPPLYIGWFFIIIGSIVMLSSWVSGALMLVAGGKLRAHTSRTFCLVVAGLECMNFPLGTVLGVFTIIVLTKDSVIEMFDHTHSEGV
jgi:hypothetical protein